MENSIKSAQLEVNQFGEKKESMVYKPRPGVYAICVNDENQLAVVEYKGRLYLLGGGLNEGETEEAGLRREIEEEVGMKMTSSVFVGKANQYVEASDGNFNKEGVFYKIELDGTVSVSGEADHKFIWVDKEEFKAKAGQEFQVFAIVNFV